MMLDYGILFGISVLLDFFEINDLFLIIDDTISRVYKPIFYVDFK